MDSSAVTVEAETLFCSKSVNKSEQGYGHGSSGKVSGATRPSSSIFSRKRR